MTFLRTPRAVIPLRAGLLLAAAALATPAIAAPADEGDREVSVRLGEPVAAELGEEVEELNVELRKTHGDGKETLVDASFVGNTEAEKRVVLHYPRRKADEDAQEWLHYEYRAVWSFQDGGSHETDWAPADSPYVSIGLPFARERVDLIGDVEMLREQGVKRIIVEVEHVFFGKKPRKVRKELELDRPIEGEHIDLVFPLDVLEYQYRIRWLPKGLETHGDADSTVLVLDELPGEGSR